MREYTTLSPQFWTGETGKKLRGNLEAQVLALYLVSSPHANMLGLYYLPIPYICHETGLPLEGALKGLASLSEGEFAHYDHDAECVWVVEMAKFQLNTPLHEKDHRVKGVNREYNSLPTNCFLGQFFTRYSADLRLDVPRGSKGASKSHRRDERARADGLVLVPDPDLDLKGGVGGNGSDPMRGFDEFWAAYPRKVGKPRAGDKWRTKGCSKLIAVIMAAVEVQKQTPQWTKDGGQFIPHPATWLHNERWADEVTKPAPPPHGGWVG